MAQVTDINTARTAADITSPLRKSAMLVKVVVTKPTTSRANKRARDEVAADHHAQKDSVSVHNRILSREFTKPLDGVCQKARDVVNKAALPWDDDGWRILQKSDYMALKQEVANIERELKQTVMAQLGQYPLEVQRAKQRLGSMFNPANYPSTGEILQKYSITLRHMPFPDADDFRADVSDSVGAAIAQQARDEYAKQYGDSLQEVVTVFGDLAQKSLERLEGGNLTSVLDNLVEMADKLERMNLTGDPKVARLASEARRRLTSISDRKALSRDKRQRAAAAQDVKSLIDDFSDMWG